MSDKIIIRIVRGRTKRLSRWLVEVTDNGVKSYPVTPSASKKDAIRAARYWVNSNGLSGSVTFIIPSRDGA